MLGQVVVNSITLSITYALFALGFAIIFSVMGVLNFAHGALLMLGGYCVYYLTVGWFELSYPVALVATFVIVGLVGIVIERGLLRPIHKELFICLVVTLAISNLFQEGGPIIFGGGDKILPRFFSGVFELGNVFLPLNRIVISLVSGLLLLGVFLVLNQTKMGRAMRAVAQDEEAAALQGITIGSVYSFGMFLSCGLAGAAGALVALYTPVSPMMGVEPLFTAFIIVIVGGLGSLSGALVASFILGFLQSFVTSYIGAIMASMFSFVILIIILLLRPRGLFGKA